MITLLLSLLFFDAFETISESFVATDCKLVSPVSLDFLEFIRALPGLCESSNLGVSVIDRLLVVLLRDQVLSILEVKVSDVVVAHACCLQVEVLLILVHEALPGQVHD